MGFYSPATLVKDAQRHGVRVLPIDVARSQWNCVLEGGDPTPSVRLGLRCVAGLREETGRALADARRSAPFRHVADLCARVPLRRDEIDTLAELGALASIDRAAKTRRAALWQVSALERDPRSLFAGVPPPSADSPLPEMSPIEETLADYRRSGLTTGPHVMSFLRPRLAARGVLRASDLRDVPDGRFVRTAGHCIVRQRPSSAKGFCFLTLEDETGTSNAVLTPRIFRRFRMALHSAAIVEVAGPIQHVDGVIHVRVRELRALAAGAALPRSHDYR